MQPEIRTALDRLLQQQPLDEATMQQAIGAIMDGRCSEVEVTALLVALAVKGETEDELAGAAAAMRERAAVIPCSRTGLIDTCGTGGDKLHTFNISTATAFVIAGAGVPVAKNGNRSVSSSSGSADVLEALGVKIELTPEQMGACLDDVGLSFCYARVCHSAMKNVASVRQQLGMRTIFNLLGPLTNPAQAEFQLLGAFRNQQAEKVAGALRRLHPQRAMVVCGNDQLDEVSLWGTTRVWEITGGDLREWELHAADFQLPECTPDDLRVNTSDESAEVIRKILKGQPGPARNIVLANAALALVCRGEAPDVAAGVKQAAASIDEGRATKVLEALVEWTNR